MFLVSLQVHVALVLDAVGFFSGSSTSSLSLYSLSLLNGLAMCRVVEERQLTASFQ